MDLISALRAVAPHLPDDAISGLERARPALLRAGALASPRRAAHLIGQCAHESAGFTHRFEVLYYRSPERLLAVFPRHFRNRAEAEPLARNPRALANRVYAGRMGNGGIASGDGYRYRGRGWLQLTGRANYARMGAALGLDLERQPDLAARADIAWSVAGVYLATRRSAGRSALEWADLDNVERVTRIVNGGLNGLTERRRLTALALSRLSAGERHLRLARGDEGEEVLLLQSLLARRGFAPGPLDGAFGPRTERAVRALQKAMGRPVNGVVVAADWHALQPPDRAPDAAPAQIA